MLRDLRSVVVKLCQFLEKYLEDPEIDKIVEKAKFKSMKTNGEVTNGMPEDLIGKGKKVFFRKGTAGDWKNVMTVAQSEIFDKIYQEKMKDLPIKVVWE